MHCPVQLEDCGDSVSSQRDPMENRPERRLHMMSTHVVGGSIQSR